MENKSFEQLIEDYTRQVRETKGQILEDFYKAYAAQLAHLGKDFSLDDICLVEHQCDGPLSMNRKYWFEFKPKFEDIE
jgi:hypothetical protein